MPGKSERKYSPDVNDYADLRQAYDDLFERHENLKSDANTVAREYQAMRNDGTAMPHSTAGLFLVLAACLVVGRLVLYQFVEDAGSSAHIEGLISDVLFAAGSGVLLLSWVKSEWQEIRWLAVPKFVFVFVMLLICASTESGGALLDGDISAPAVHPIIAGLMAIATLLLAASPLFVYLAGFVFAFVNDPKNRHS